MKSEIITRIEKDDKVIELDFEEGRELCDRLMILYHRDYEQASLPLESKPLNPFLGTYTATDIPEEHSGPVRENISSAVAKIKVKKSE